MLMVEQDSKCWDVTEEEEHTEAELPKPRNDEIETCRSIADETQCCKRKNRACGENYDSRSRS